MAQQAMNANISPERYSTPVLPDGQGGFVPCPDLLTTDEAIRYLRLDIDGPSHPSKTLTYYREKGLLRATRVGRRLRYRLDDLRRFLAELAKAQQV